MGRGAPKQVHIKAYVNQSKRNDRKALASKELRSEKYTKNEKVLP